MSSNESRCAPERAGHGLKGILLGTMERATPPVPSTVSEQAQRFLANSLKPTVGPEPALDDVDVWLRTVKEGDAYLIERFGGRFVPVASITSNGRMFSPARYRLSWKAE